MQPESLEKQRFEGKMHERFSKSNEIREIFNALMNCGPWWIVEELAAP